MFGREAASSAAAPAATAGEAESARHARRPTRTATHRPYPGRKAISPAPTPTPGLGSSALRHLTVVFMVIENASPTARSETGWPAESIRASLSPASKAPGSLSGISPVLAIHQNPGPAAAILGFLCVPAVDGAAQSALHPTPPADSAAGERRLPFAPGSGPISAIP